MQTIDFYWRPATRDYRLTIRQLIDLAGRGEERLGRMDIEELGARLSVAGAEMIGQARVNCPERGTVTKDVVWSVPMGMTDSVLDVVRGAKIVGPCAGSKAVRRVYPTQLDRVEAKQKCLEQKLDRLLQILDK
jgi:hypothetical protein